jgi:hypothetical protein
MTSESKISLEASHMAASGLYMILLGIGITKALEPIVTIDLFSISQIISNWQYLSALMIFIILPTQITMGFWQIFYNIIASGTDIWRKRLLLIMAFFFLCSITTVLMGNTLEHSPFSQDICIRFLKFLILFIVFDVFAIVSANAPWDKLGYFKKEKGKSGVFCFIGWAVKKIVFVVVFGIFGLDFYKRFFNSEPDNLNVLDKYSDDRSKRRGYILKQAHYSWLSWNFILFLVLTLAVWQPSGQFLDFSFAIGYQSMLFLMLLITVISVMHNFTFNKDYFFPDKAQDSQIHNESKSL